MTQHVAELRDVLEKGGTNWFGYKEVSVAVKRLDEMIKDERYDRIPDLLHKIESAIYKAVPKLKPGTVEKRTGYTKVKAKLIELANPSDKTKGNSSYDELTILIERVQHLAHSLWESDYQPDASIVPSRKNLLQSLDYMEHRISETGRILRRMDRLRKELISIHNTLRMIKVKPRQRIIAEREEIKDTDTLEQICASLMKLSDSVVDMSTQETIESPRESLGRERETSVGQIEKNDLQHIQEWVSWLELSTKPGKKEAVKPLSQSDKRLVHHVHTSEKAASMEKVIRKSSDTIISLTQELEAANTSNQQLEDRLSTTIKELQNENIDLIKQKDKNKKGIPTKRRPSLIGNDREEVQKQIDKLMQEKKKLTNDLREATKQKEHWMNKLSNVTGAKPLAGKTPVVDFDDPSTPQNLALRFGELFDNEWKKSLKIIVAKDPTQQKDAILQLATILKLSYHHCVHISSQQLRNLSDALFNLEGNQDQSQQKNGNKVIPDQKIQVIRQVQKLSAPNTKEYVLNSFHEKLKKNKMDLTLEEIPQYLKECIEICWYMTINNPQLIFVWPDEEGKENVTIDLEKFTYYTLVGDVIDYVVWPAMLMEDGGSLLRKGVVEPVEKN